VDDPAHHGCEQRLDAAIQFSMGKPGGQRYRPADTKPSCDKKATPAHGRGHAGQGYWEDQWHGQQRQPDQPLPIAFANGFSQATSHRGQVGSGYPLDGSAPFLFP